ncbi:TetR/AcrR family transcriptional regulator [Mycobacterium xenopi]|uniref:TetR family transcriptional regulator n=1 Tax=Mycobacterium xenopi TaxID=1789 RepID=A0AAD1M0D9_MYCXE|nr:TetR/AcrR family transcriptional regulator [Mycobacterium xenopi]ORX19751.1 TetR family transcriptional regulator [Mycobacterium xenopi]BBU21340.1 TetR family transcriptional regulator [Mycobacterium xenopi]SPX78769.1 TetR family transcriptional regulator [Mycobacterium xenopi]
MASPRRFGPPDAKTRTMLLDAAEQLMLDEGWAAVTGRRVAEKAGLRSQLVHYYFRSMDELLLAVFRRRAEQSFKANTKALNSPQPLWALWRMFNNPPFSAFTMELFALANHRAELRAELACYAQRFRDEQAQTFAKVLSGYGVDTEQVPPVAVAFLLTGVQGVLFMEEALGISAGHTEVVALVERYLRDVEGDPVVP